MALQQIMPLNIWFNNQMTQFTKEQKRYNKIEDFVFARATDQKNVLTSTVSKALLESFIDLNSVFEDVLKHYESIIDPLYEADKKGVALLKLIHHKKKQHQAAANITKLWELYAPICENITRLQERCKLITPLIKKTEALMRKEIN